MSHQQHHQLVARAALLEVGRLRAELSRASAFPRGGSPSDTPPSPLPKLNSTPRKSECRASAASASSSPPSPSALLSSATAATRRERALALEVSELRRESRDIADSSRAEIAAARASAAEAARIAARARESGNAAAVRARNAAATAALLLNTLGDALRAADGEGVRGGAGVAKLLKSIAETFSGVRAAADVWDGAGVSAAAAGQGAALDAFSGDECDTRALARAALSSAVSDGARENARLRNALAATSARLRLADASAAAHAGIDADVREIFAALEASRARAETLEAALIAEQMASARARSMLDAGVTRKPGADAALSHAAPALSQQGYEPISSSSPQPGGGGASSSVAAPPPAPTAAVTREQLNEMRQNLDVMDATLFAAETAVRGARSQALAAAASAPSSAPKRSPTSTVSPPQAPRESRKMTGNVRGSPAPTPAPVLSARLRSPPFRSPGSASSALPPPSTSRASPPTSVRASPPSTARSSPSPTPKINPSAGGRPERRGRPLPTESQTHYAARSLRGGAATHSTADALDTGSLAPSRDSLSADAASDFFGDDERVAPALVAMHPLTLPDSTPPRARNDAPHKPGDTARDTTTLPSPLPKSGRRTPPSQRSRLPAPPPQRYGQQEASAETSAFFGGSLDTSTGSGASEVSLLVRNAVRAASRAAVARF